jgi:hypothetical protein
MRGGHFNARYCISDTIAVFYLTLSYLSNLLNILVSIFIVGVCATTIIKYYSYYYYKLTDIHNHL